MVGAHIMVALLQDVALALLVGHHTNSSNISTIWGLEVAPSSHVVHLLHVVAQGLFSSLVVPQ